MFVELVLDGLIFCQAFVLIDKIGQLYIEFLSAIVIPSVDKKAIKCDYSPHIRGFNTITSTLHCNFFKKRNLKVGRLQELCSVHAF